MKRIDWTTPTPDLPRAMAGCCGAYQHVWEPSLDELLADPVLRLRAAAADRAPADLARLTEAAARPE